MNTHTKKKTCVSCVVTVNGLNDFCIRVTQGIVSALAWCFCSSKSHSVYLNSTKQEITQYEVYNGSRVYLNSTEKEIIQYEVSTDEPK